MESVNGKYFGPVYDREKAAMFDTEEEAARAYDIVANEMFKCIDRKKFNATFHANIGIAGHVDENDFDKALACTWCGGLVFTTFTIEGPEKLCWDCFNETVTCMMTVMTLEHPRWGEFIRKMTAKGFCGGDMRVNGRISKKSFAVQTLREMGMNVHRSIDYFEEHGADCGCEIILNIYLETSFSDEENDYIEISERYFGVEERSAAEGKAL